MALLADSLGPPEDKLKTKSTKSGAAGGNSTFQPVQRAACSILATSVNMSQATLPVDLGLCVSQWHVSHSRSQKDQSHSIPTVGPAGKL